MKNVHLIPTDKPSKLRIGNNGNFVIGLSQNATVSKNDSYTNQNIYITNDGEIKEGDWYIDTSVFKENIAIDRGIYQMKYFKWGIEGQGDCKKIILTTDQELIKYGVQAIDDEFLEWFVKNPSCEEVYVVDARYDISTLTNDVKKYPNLDVADYKIIIPKEEPKQETQGYICPHTKKTM